MFEDIQKHKWKRCSTYIKSIEKSLINLKTQLKCPMSPWSCTDAEPTTLPLKSLLRSQFYTTETICKSLTTNPLQYTYYKKTNSQNQCLIFLPQNKALYLLLACQNLRTNLMKITKGKSRAVNRYHIRSGNNNQTTTLDY